MIRFACAAIPTIGLLVLTSCETAVGPTRRPDARSLRDVSPSTTSQLIRINAQQTFLRTEPEDISQPPFTVSLATLGIQPGDMIQLEETGAFALCNTCADTYTVLLGVFSSSFTVLSPTTPNRVPDALATNLSFTTGPTLNQHLPTDIPADFAIGSVQVQVPAGSKYLLLGVNDDWFKDNVDPNGDLGVRLTYTPHACGNLQSLVVEPANVTGGTAGPAGVVGTISLQEPTHPFGIPVSLTGETVWPVTDLRSPIIVSVPDQVTVPASQTSITFPITTSRVLYPLHAKIAARSCTSTTFAELLLTPPPIPSFGPEADRRVRAILDEVVVNRNYEQALKDVIVLRNSDPASGIKQDIYLAAADHYLFALTWVLNNPWALVLVRDVIPLYEIKKLADKLLGLNPDESRPTVLSVDWGEQGVTDAAIILLGAGAVRGGPPTGRP